MIRALVHSSRKLGRIPTVLLVALSWLGSLENDALGRNGKGREPGLVWVFFHDVAMRRPADLGIDRDIDLDTGREIKDFARIWMGWIEGPGTGDVTFHAEADDGLRLWIGGRLVIDGWSGDVREGVFSFARKDEPVPFQLYFFQNGGTAHMRLYWRWENHPRQLIPPSAFWHTGEESRLAWAIRDRKPVRGAEEVPLSTKKARVYVRGRSVPVQGPIRLRKGPHLFLDDLLIERSVHLTRKVNVPERDKDIPNPLVTGKEDGCFQPYLTVLRDPDTGRFRLWYGCRTDDRNPGASRIGYMESKDGVHWIRPHRVLADPAPIQFGVSVIDEGRDHPEPARRFKYGWWKDGGLRVASSFDGLTWIPMVPHVVLPHNHDINSIFHDPLREGYLATISVYIEGPWRGRRRVTMQSRSRDLLTWTEPHHVLVPDARWDEGETQFYAMDGFLVRGGLLIGMVKVLRDDLRADEPPDPPNQYGIGYTCLAWTRDGETWVRDPTPFFRPDPRRGTWDHAHAWIDEQLLVGDEVYLYYGGYARGHKVNRFEERQIGLVRMLRDRYVSREAGDRAGRLITPLVILEGDRMTLNVDGEGGEVGAEVLDDEYRPIPGFTSRDCMPICTDALSAPLRWMRPLKALKDRPVHVSLSLRNARLFALNVR